MRLPFFITTAICAILIVCCVSRTVPSERFRESKAMTAPTLGISLPDNNNFTFAVVGDLHIGNADTTRFRRILAAAAAEGDAFLVLLGDLVDTGQRADVEAYRKALTDAGYGNRVFSVIGNHDIFHDGWESFRDLNGPATYSFTAGNSRFIVLDSADGSLGDDQFDWFGEELKKSRPTHLFVASHYLPIIPDQRTYLKLADLGESLRLMGMARDANVRAWFGAHYHSYIVKNVQDVTYVVAGGGGGRRMEPVKDFFFVQVRVAGDDVRYVLKTVE